MKTKSHMNTTGRNVNERDTKDIMKELKRKENYCQQIEQKELKRNLRYD
jgi:hypothetical protein